MHTGSDDLRLFIKNSQVIQKLTDEKELVQKISFNGRVVAENILNEDEAFSGDLQVWISDEWHDNASGFKIKKFVFEKLD